MAPLLDTMKRIVCPLSIGVMGCDLKSPVGNNSVLLFICSVKTLSEDFIQHVIQADEKCTLLNCYLHALCKE